MSPLNSNKLKKFHFTTSQNNVTITVQKCSVFFSSFFQSMYCLFKKCSFFLSFFSSFICCVQQCSCFFSFFFFLFHLHCPVAFFFFLFFSVFIFFLFFFHNKLLIQCPFLSTLYLPLCLYLNTITIGSLPSLFNFSLQYHKLSLIYNTTFSIAYEHSSFFFFFHKISRVFFSKQPKLL